MPHDVPEPIRAIPQEMAVAGANNRQVHGDRLRRANSYRPARRFHQIPIRIRLTPLDLARLGVKAEDRLIYRVNQSVADEDWRRMVAVFAGTERLMEIPLTITFQVIADDKATGLVPSSSVNRIDQLPIAARSPIAGTDFTLVDFWV